MINKCGRCREATGLRDKKALHMVCAKVWMSDLIRQVAQEMVSAWSSRISDATSWEQIAGLGMELGREFVGRQMDAESWDLFQRWYTRAVGSMPSREEFSKSRWTSSNGRDRACQRVAPGRRRPASVMARA